MSISIANIVNLRPNALKRPLCDEAEELPARETEKSRGGIFSDGGFTWLSSGPFLEVISTKKGHTMGAWSFGWVLKDLHTEVVCVEEVQRPNGRLPLLAVGVNSDFSGGMICIFDFARSKVIRAIQIRDKITNLHVIDAGCDVFSLPGPLRSFDGIIAAGTEGGDVFLVDICRQICDEASAVDMRDELNPCQLSNITARDIAKIEFHKELAMRNSQHLAIHLNVVYDKSTRHFTLKGPKGDDRIHVNKEEVAVSALYYCPQLGSLLIGYNFGALQLYNLMNLDLIYTSPVCEEHIPIAYFAVQEPADDPRAFCYIWAVYSSVEERPTCLPLAVMYAFCYHSKEYHEGYGILYQDFNQASIHYQMELAVPKGFETDKRARGGTCLKLTSISEGPVNREGPHHDSNEDNITLCTIAWNVWYTNRVTDTFLAVFDLNQWYKEQMPNVPSSQYSLTYMVQVQLTDLVNSATNKSVPVLDVHTIKNSFVQFKGAQKLEEHFCPNSLSFDLYCLRENDVILLRNYGVQKALLAQIESSGPLCLVEPAEVYQNVVGLGLVPLYIDVPTDSPISTTQQREVILGAALENRLIGWLCKCASEWANGSFLSAGCSLDLLLNWAFQRAAALKSSSDAFCTSLFDYSGVRLDNNANVLLNCCVRQLNGICTLYNYVIRKLSVFVSNFDLVGEQYKSLQRVVVYFEVLQWLLNVGLLPECPISAYPRSDEMERINAPYPAEMLMDYYNHRRAQLKISNEQNFASEDSVLFIDNLIERECGGGNLQQQWRNDGGNGLYPPPSLQSLLRTYLVENVDLSYKHSVVIYVFLDLAMTLDQERYKPVITYLIKFPAVFKVSPGVIKLTQAFWQLDHGDYNTAMGLLLDPLISIMDLKSWHHKVVLRSLMLQKQHNFVLLYINVRKPPIVDDDDVFSVISSYVANSMLSEAFYFERQFTSPDKEERYLVHLFNECKRNGKLKSLIYRTLNPTEEKCFLKYLQNSNESTNHDILVHYHLLRSRYYEAFESHECTMPNQVENRGLEGQEDAHPRESLINLFKSMLPEINREVLSLCRKEKTNIWKQVSKPTPLSVFVHNTTENVQYKSTLLGAALAKAKQTFSETQSRFETETTPFLRAPRAFNDSKRLSAVVMTPKIIDDTTPPSAKRLKLSHREASFASASSKLETPVIKRKMARAHSERQDTATPHSILKVKGLVDASTKNEDQFQDNFEAFEKLSYTPVSSLAARSTLGLSSRKSLTKPSPVVRFEGLKANAAQDNSLPSTSKNTSTEEETFYSPDASLEDKEVTAEKERVTDTDVSNKIEEITAEKPSVDKIEIAEEKPSSGPVFSPKARKSYRSTLSPVRSSPRLASKTLLSSPKKAAAAASPKKVMIQEEKEKEETVCAPVPEDAAEQEPKEIVKSSPVLPKLRSRRSLCRQVLETNALSRLDSHLESPRSRRSVTAEHVETTEKVTLESTTRYSDGERIHNSSLIRRHNLSTTIESELDSSADFSFKFVGIEVPKFSEGKENAVDQKKPHVSDSRSEKEVEETGQDISETELVEQKAPEDNTADKKNVSAQEEEPMDVEQPKEEKQEAKVDQTEGTSEDSEDSSSGSVSPHNRPVDPEMNVFEISDALNVSDGVARVQQEVRLEENDLCYDQQNTLEKVLEGIMAPPFEKNVYDVSSEEEEEEESFEEEAVNVANVTAEVIEIGSSSEDEKQNVNEESEPSLDYDSNDDLPVSYEKNIYDSDQSSICYSELDNRNSSENSSDRSTDEYGLFQGEIILVDEQENEEMTEEQEDGEMPETEESKNDEEDNEESTAKNRREPKIFDDFDETSNEEETVNEMDATASIDHTRACGLLYDDLASVDEEESGEEAAQDKKDEKSETIQQKSPSPGTIHDSREEKCEETGETSVQRSVSPDAEQEIDAEKSRSQQDPLDATEDQTNKEETLQQNEDEQMVVENKEETENESQIEPLNTAVGEENEDHVIVENQEEKSANVLDTTVGEDQTVTASNTLETIEEMDELVYSTIEENEPEKSNLHEEQSVLDEDRIDPLDITPIPIPEVPVQLELDPLDIMEIEPVEDTTSQKSRTRSASTSSTQSSRRKESETAGEKSEAASKLRGMRTRSASTSSTSSRRGKDSKTVVEDSEDKSTEEVTSIIPEVRTRSASVNSTSSRRRKGSETVIEENKDKSTEDVSSEEPRTRSASVSSRKTVVEDGEESIRTPSDKAVTEKKEGKSTEEVTSIIPEARTRSASVSSTTSSRRRKDSKTVTEENEDKSAEDVSNEEPIRTRSAFKGRKDKAITEESEEARTRSASVSSTSSGRRKDSKSISAESEEKSEQEVSSIIAEPRTRSASISSTSSRRKKDSKEQTENKSAEEAQPPRRILTRRKTEEMEQPARTLRKRSASADEVEPSAAQATAKKEDTKKSRKQRAASVTPLPTIDEEHVLTKRPASVLDDYTSSRRVTRRQLNLLKKTIPEDGPSLQSDLDRWDPTVVLDQLPVEGKCDPEEKTSPSTSPSSVQEVAKRRLRSESQASEASHRSGSQTPEKSLKKRTRSTSTEEGSEVRTTRSRARSASVASDDSNASEGAKAKGQKLQAVSSLPQIKEEEVPKKRTRRTTPQK